MNSFDKLPGLLDSIYIAAEEPEAWPSVLTGIMSAFDVMRVDFFINVGSSSPDGILTVTVPGFRTLESWLP